jgi:alpha-beta hydrolase superfamily lysophospholipase
MSDDGSPILERQEQITASDGIGLTIHRYSLEPRLIRGTILSLHGIQSHAAWYARSSRRLAEAGFDVRFLDRRGSGRSTSARGHAEHWERLVNDVVATLRWIRHERPPGPIVLQAVSWGGKLAATVTRLHPELVDALALLYPGIHARIRPGVRQTMLLKLADIARVRRRSVLIPLDDPTLFTSDPAWQQFLREDPLSIRVATTGFLNADRRLSELARTSGPEIRCPVLLMLAGRDRIIDNPAMKQFFATIASPSKTLIEFPNAAHTLEFEPCFEEFVQKLIAWLNALSPDRGDAA